jgi:anaerobic ribonucleoside-triphosphate reductase activating protein
VKINLFRIGYPVTSLGPGKRLVIWVAGCRKRCPSCISPEMRDPAAGAWIESEELAEHILRLPYAFDGITVSGGEPFDQAAAVAALIRQLRSMHAEWDTLIYSGYRLATLRKHAERRILLAETDILIDGPFRHAVPSFLALAGSGNQRIHFLTERGLGQKDAVLAPLADAAVLGMGRDGMRMLIGVLSPQQRQGWHQALGLIKGEQDGV